MRKIWLEQLCWVIKSHENVTVTICQKFQLHILINAIRKTGATRSYLRKVTRFRGLIDLFFRNQRQDLVCITRISKKGDPVGPTSGRFRGRRYQFEPINRSTATILIVISLILPQISRLRESLYLFSCSALSNRSCCFLAQQPSRRCKQTGEGQTRVNKFPR